MPLPTLIADWPEFRWCDRVAEIPTTSTTLLRDLAQDSQHARWGEFVARYRWQIREIQVGSAIQHIIDSGLGWTCLGAIP